MSFSQKYGYFFFRNATGAELRNTYHVQLSRVPSFGLGSEQRAVMPCLGLPGAVEVVRHQVDEVYISTEYNTQLKQTDSGKYLKRKYTCQDMY